MVHRPVIGISADHDTPSTRLLLNHAYVEAVTRAGGVAVVLPFAQDPEHAAPALSLCDGLLLTGGNDPDPGLWGTDTRHPMTRPVDPRRERFDLALLRLAETRGLPVLGVCLGMQLMNIHRGGGLIQFLPDHPRENAIEHRRMNDRDGRHAVALSAGSVISRVFGADRVEVNSRHKQAVWPIGKGLSPTAQADDGVVEAIEDTRPGEFLFLGVQWHPEALIDEPAQLGLFGLLVEQAARRSHAMRKGPAPESRGRQS